MALTQSQTKLLSAARKVAVELGGREKALTGLIGELSACEKDLKWEPSDGYDARTLSDLTVQIKTSRIPQRGETMGWFGRKKRGQRRSYPFDIAMFVELDSKFNVAGIWHMSVHEVKILEDEETSTWGLRISRFQEHGELLKD